jgi:hypothetical protein
VFPIGAAPRQCKDEYWGSLLSLQSKMIEKRWHRESWQLQQRTGLRVPELAVGRWWRNLDISVESWKFGREEVFVCAVVARLKFPRSIILPSSGSDSEAWNMQQSEPLWWLLHVNCLFCLFFDPEDEGDIFLQIVDWLSPGLYPKRQNFISLIHLTRDYTASKSASVV